MTDTEQVFFFGCWGEPGHYLFSTSKQRYGNNSCPFKAENLDYNILLPLSRTVGDGSIFRVHGWTIVTWWGNPWDKRPGTNNAILLKGGYGFEAAWEIFQRNFPQLNIIPKPQIVESHD